MKYFITNTSMNDELLDDEILSPNESRVLDKVNLSTLPSAFTVRVIKDKELDSLGNGTSSEDISGVESADESNTNQGESEDSVDESVSSTDTSEGDQPSLDVDMSEYLNSLSKEDLKKILAAKGDEGCTARSEWKIAQYIQDNYPELTKNDILSILGE